MGRAHKSRVGEPDLHVLVGVEALALEDERRTAGGGDPAADPVGGVPALGDRPVAEHLQDAAGGQVGGTVGDDAPHELVAGQ